MNDKKPVFFLRRHKAFNAGEIAGFPTKEANKLVAEKIALHYDAEKKEVINQAPEPDKESNDPPAPSGYFNSLLDQTAVEIEEKLEAKNEGGEYVLSADDLQQLMQEESAGKDRKGVKTSIENELMRRVEAG